MKTTNLLTAALMGGVLWGNAHAVDFHAILTGSQEVPPADTQASGECNATLSPGRISLRIECTHDVQQPTAAHIHLGAVGVSGPVVVSLGDPTSPITATWILADNSCEFGAPCLPELLAGNMYVNIHSPAFPAGEIRGQLIRTDVDPFVPDPVPAIAVYGLGFLAAALAGIGIYTRRRRQLSQHQSKRRD